MELPLDADSALHSDGGAPETLWRRQLLAFLVVVLVVAVVIGAVTWSNASTPKPGEWTDQEHADSLHFANFSFATDAHMTPSLDEVEIVRDRVTELFPDTAQWDLVRTARIDIQIDLPVDPKECAGPTGWDTCHGISVMYVDQDTDSWFGQSLGPDGGAYVIGLDPQLEGIQQITFKTIDNYEAPAKSVAMVVDLKAAPALSYSQTMGMGNHAMLVTGTKGLAILQELADGFGNPAIAEPFVQEAPDFYGEVVVRFKDPAQARDLVIQLRDTDWAYGYSTTHELPEEE